MSLNKVFGIGLSKTGTCSLCKAMEILGYRSIHYPSPSQYYNDLLKKDMYDFACDQPICNRYIELMNKYPSAKFIFTIRDKDDWLKSIKKHFESTGFTGVEWGLDYRRETFDTLTYNYHLLSNIYEEHISDVVRLIPTYKLLVMDICGGEGWEVLTAFLGINTTFSDPFPFLNRTTQ